MLEARLEKASLFKKIVESFRELVNDVNFECSETGISLEAMDQSHVALVVCLMRSEGFESYRCDRHLPLGVNMTSLSKMLKCANNDDAMTLKADDNGDVVSLIFESPKNDRVSDYEMKLMSIDTEHLGIPDTPYDAIVQMPSAEFQRICRDLTTLSESVTIAATKEGIKFSASGDLGSGNVLLKQNAAMDDDEVATTITLNKPVVLSFSLKYLGMFSKAVSLSDTVRIEMHEELPMMIEYKMEDLGYVRFYLAPKIDQE